MSPHGQTYRAAQDELRNYIAAHGLVPGDRLPAEAELAEQFGMSRLSIREATRSLQTLGVLQARPGRGLYVADFSFGALLDQLPYSLAGGSTALHEVLVAREAMEVGLMPAVLAVTDAAHLADCERIVSTMDARERRGRAVPELDREFHHALYRPLRNPLVDNLIGIFWTLFANLREGPPPRPVSDKHRAILDSLRQNDAVAAMRSMREHFVEVKAQALSLVADDRSDST